MHALIAESLKQPRPPVKESVDLRERLLRDLQKASGVSEQVARQHLERLTPHERWSLLQFSAPDLRDWLLKSYKLDDLEVSPNLESVCYPELPENLLVMLTAWETKNRNRLIARMNSGHSRSPTTLRRMMAEPIALARFLSENGITRWDAMKMSDRVAFAKTRQKRVQQKLRPFLAFLEGASRFGAKRGRRPKKSASAIRETRQIPILQPDVLKARIKEAKQRLPADQYLLYWLVARLGLTAKAAYGITLDKITVNQKGRVVIRPADAWFALPKSLASTMERLARAADTQWPYLSPQDAPPIPVMAGVIPKSRIGKDIYQNETTLLRSSAIFAAMHDGMLDRKSLSAITGVSHTTIAIMEFMVPADIHSLGSHKLVTARNKMILGKDD